MSEKNIKLDQRVLDLYNKTKELKAEIETISKPKWKTKGTFKYNPSSNNSGDVLFIQTITEVRDLLMIIAYLKSLKDAYESTDLKFILTGELPKFTWQEYSYSDWYEDIKARIALIEIHKKRSNLNSLETRLNGLLSQEQRRELELAEIEKELLK